MGVAFESNPAAFNATIVELSVAPRSPHRHLKEGVSVGFWLEVKGFPLATDTPDTPWKKPLFIPNSRI